MSLSPFLSIAMLLAQDPSASGYEFVVDGAARQPRIEPLDGPAEKVAPGDVVYLRQFPIVLEGPGSYRFRTTPKEDGRLFRIGADGQERVVGAMVSWTYPDDKKVIINPLARLSDEELRGLRSLRLDEWPEGIEKSLARLDAARVALVVTDKVAREGRLPELPLGLRYLEVDETSSSGIRDYRSLAAQKDLVYFRARTLSGLGWDCSTLKASRSLRNLNLSMCSPTNLNALSDHTELRVLDLSWNRELKDLGWTRGLKSLRVLNLDKSGVEDLSPLEGSASLTSVSAQMTAARILPKGPMPALKELRIMSTPLKAEDVDAFQAAHPGCAVAFRWEGALRAGLADVTRLRVRSGGTCHRQTDEEKTLIESNEAAAIKELADGIKIDERRSGFHCMCCGDISLEFYRGETLAVTIGFHHGSGLRWSDGWPGDAAITAESADFLVDWLAARKVGGPKEERDRGKRSQAALHRRWDRYRAILPAETYAALREAKSEGDGRKALEAAAPDASGRARLCLRLFGCDDGSWNLYAGLDQLLHETLSEVSDEVLSEAVVALLNDRQGGIGAARWILNEQKAKSLTPEARAKALPVLTRVALSHPRDLNRRRALQALIELKDPSVTAVLKEVVAGTLVPRKLEAADADEPGGMVSAVAGDSDVADDVTTRAYAAYALAQTGDKSARDAIRALRGKSTAGDQELVDRSLRLLGDDK
jgi:hypothetical protein